MGIGNNLTTLQNIFFMNKIYELMIFYVQHQYY